MAWDSSCSTIEARKPAMATTNPVTPATGSRFTPTMAAISAKLQCASKGMPANRPTRTDPVNMGSPFDTGAHVATGASGLTRPHGGGRRTRALAPPVGETLAVLTGAPIGGLLPFG